MLEIYILFFNLKKKLIITTSHKICIPPTIFISIYDYKPLIVTGV